MITMEKVNTIQKVLEEEFRKLVIDKEEPGGLKKYADIAFSYGDMLGVWCGAMLDDFPEDMFDWEDTYFKLMEVLYGENYWHCFE